jgi:Trypsin-like peptidase domain
MRKFLLVMFLLTLATFAAYKYEHRGPSQPIPMHANHIASLEAKASHMIVFENSDGDPQSGCTATAVGPHALMTADHCNDDDKLKTVQLDMGVRKYHIVDKMHDKRDHVIYLVDGPEFKNTVRISTSVPSVNDPVYLIGSGGGTFPGEYKQGVVLDEYDPSDVDSDAGMVYASIPGIPGDSGAAIYAQDGTIVGLLTYGFSEKTFYGRRELSEIAFFQLDFSSKQIAKAETFVAPEPKKEVKHVEVRTIDWNTFNPFK